MQDVWIGYTLYDREPTIIHHFAQATKFRYPHIASGFAMSITLLKRYISHVYIKQSLLYKSHKIIAPEE